ncbi:nucleotide exchange factor GrpE, partial [Pseudomonas sp. ATCC 13867]
MSDEQQTQDSQFNEQPDTGAAEDLNARVLELEEQVAA